MKSTLYICLLWLGLSGVVWAQAGAGSAAVTGTVLESSGDGIPDTTVTLSNPGLGFERVMTTSDDGVFNASALTPAAGYRIKITRKGFNDWTSGDFSLSVGQTLDFRVTLKHDEGYTGDEAAIPAPRVEEVKNDLSTLVTTQQIDNLPSSNRRIDPLAQLDPLAGIDHRTGGIMLTAQPASNLTVTDGVVTTNTYYASPRALANQLTLDSVQEFQVLPANAPPAFGPSSGGIVNVVTRSGTNDLHVAGYDYYSPNAVAATNRFANGQSLFDHLNQGGASAGGPIIRDHIFFFGNVEDLDGKGRGLNKITSPLLADPTGTTILSSTCKATSVQCASAIKFLQSQMNVVTPLSESFLTGLAKVDYRRSERNSFTVEGNILNAKAPNGGSIQQVDPNGGLLGLVNATDDVRFGKVAWTSVPTRSTLNELRLGVFDDRLSNPAYTPNIADANLGITVDGVTVGNPHPYSQSLGELRYQLTDNATLTSSTHSLSVGFELWRSRDTVTSLAGPVYQFPSLTAFATDFTSGGKDYTMLTQQIGTAERRVPWKQYNAYAVDTWRPVRRLTIMAGVRFEKPGLPKPQNQNSTYYETASIASPNIDFAPRISIAYALNEKTVARVGYGWFYEPMPGQLLDWLYDFGNGVKQTDLTVLPTMTNAPAFPKPVSGTVPTGSTDLMWASSKLRNPHVRDLNLAIERRLDASSTLTLTLLHSRGYGLYSVADENIPAPTVHKYYTIENAAGVQTGLYYTDLDTAKNDPKYAHIWVVSNGASNWYNAAVLEYRRRFRQGLTLQASYTFSQGTDDIGGPQLYGMLPLATYNGNFGGDRGISPTDQRHRGVIGWTWQPQQRWLRGWTLAGIATMASGQHETPAVWVSGQQFSGITMDYPTNLVGSGGWSRLPTDGISTLSLGNQYNLDARLSRTIALTERLKVTVLAEAFNALNRQSITAVNTVAWLATTTRPPNGAVNGPTTGVLTPVPGLGAGIAGSPARTGQVGLRVTF